MENACNFCACQDPSVVILEENYSTENLSIICIAARHLWFTHDELKAFYICDTCRDKLQEFHHFYCQVRKLYSAEPAVDESKLEPVPITTSQIELKPVTIKPEPVENDVGMLSDDGDQESNDASEDGSHSTEKLSEDVQSEMDDLPTITDEDIRIFCQMVCHICSEEFDYFADLEAHCAQEHDTKCYVNCCYSRFDDLFRIKQHVLVHLKPDIFRCEKCDKNFTSKRSLNRHLKISAHLNAGDKVFECNYCTKKYPAQHMLDDHMQSHHQKEITYHKCTLCPKEFTSFERLSFHTGIVHKTNELSQHCKVCNKLFDSEEAFHAHRGSNLCVDPQLGDAVTVGRISVRKCMICGKTFQRKVAYKEHMANHFGELAFSCDFCDRPFRNVTSMYLHRKKKHPEEYKRLKMKRKHE